VFTVQARNPLVDQFPYPPRPRATATITISGGVNAEITGTSEPPHFDLYHQQLDHREGLRRDLELHVKPLAHQALDADKAAIELGQSILKTRTFLNGGALVAIPAVVTLFGIDAKAVMRNLLVAAGVFVLGLLFSWLSGIFGFFTLSRRADRDFDMAEVTKATIYKMYYPDEPQTLRIDQVSRRANRRHRALVFYRTLAVLLSFLSLAVCCRNRVGRINNTTRATHTARAAPLIFQMTRYTTSSIYSRIERSGKSRARSRFSPIFCRRRR
jgi:hypothetical protein